MQACLEASSEMKCKLAADQLAIIHKVVIHTKESNHLESVTALSLSEAKPGSENDAADESGTNEVSVGPEIC